MNDADKRRFINTLEYALDFITAESKCYGLLEDPDYHEVKAMLTGKIHLLKELPPRKMVFVFNDEKARALGYSAEACYEVLDRLFARYGIEPTSQGVYEGPDNQNTFDAFGAAAWLTDTDWFLRVIAQWLVFDETEEPNDCLAAYYRINEKLK